MRESIFLVCVLAVTAYLVVTAWEDHKTCKVTRWKHLIGFIPAIFLLCSKIGLFLWWEYAIILAFSIVFVMIGHVGVYGMADGFVFAILTILFGSIGGVVGIAIVIIIMIAAGFSFLTNHLVICIIRREKLFKNVAAALIPHVLIGYIFAWIGLLMYAA